ncbi:hypothetical protein ACFL1G_12285 [Planctomycetota bacterium]
MNINSLASTVELRIFLNILLLIIIILVYVGIPVLVVGLMIRLFRYLRTAGRERKLLKIELGKVAEEVHLLRQELKDGEEDESSTESG